MVVEGKKISTNFEKTDFRHFGMKLFVVGSALSGLTEFIIKSSVASMPN